MLTVPMKDRSALRPYIKRPRGTLLSPWKVVELARAYNWPQNLAGGGVIGILELGGSYDPADVSAFCQANGVPEPTIENVLVGLGSRPPSDPQGADGEVALDIQVSAASYFAATGKPAHIRIYWASDIAPAIEQAAADGCDVFSISWGADENAWGWRAGRALNESAHKASVDFGMAIFAASGDNDSGDGGPGAANVDLPASAPRVIGCGGTTKPQNGQEKVWNHNPGQSNGEGTGGGYSTFWLPEAWQQGAPPNPHGNNGRMVPDVAANADPDTGYEIYLAGAPLAIGGTSAVAPLYAGLWAAFGKKPGWANRKLWADPSAFVDITVGDNGAYKALAGPDPCSGLGVPNGVALAAAKGT